jgi:L-lactate dehydrogenase complex protein LldF
MMSNFQKAVRKSLANPTLQIALDNNATNRRKAVKNALSLLENSDSLKNDARRIRQNVIKNLDKYLSRFINNLEANGFQVHQAIDAKAASEIVIQIASRHNAQLIAKSKSMITEEIGLNAALENVGLETVETDLGEYIVQLRGEHPSHIITPAVHLRRADVGRTFSEKLGVEFTTDVGTLTQHARERLRKVFLEADIGLSGVNFGVAETGTLCLVTNEGNGRMVTSLPPVHVAVMGIERLVPNLEDLGVMLQLLPRSATGQSLTSYISLINAPRGSDELDGAVERHVILLDNGRKRVSRSSLSDSLLCIRCGACLNACPVYQEIGGHAYNSVYPGPIGSVLSPALFGLQDFGHLAKASTLCGACSEICPVGIDFPTLLARVRSDRVEAVKSGGWMKYGMRIYRSIATRPRLFGYAQKIGSIMQNLLPAENGWTRKLPPPISAWTHARDFPPLAHQPFRKQFANLGPQTVSNPALSKVVEKAPDKTEDKKGRGDLIEQFSEALQALGAELHRTTMEQAPEACFQILKREQINKILAWENSHPFIEEIRAQCDGQGIDQLAYQYPASPGEERNSSLAALAEAQAGITTSSAAFANTGTVVLTSGQGQPLGTSLIPNLHICLVQESQIYFDLQQWMETDAPAAIRRATTINFISGPSRTADIEMTLTIGVHGPGKVIILLVK